LEISDSKEKRNAYTLQNIQKISENEKSIIFRNTINDESISIKVHSGPKESISSRKKKKILLNLTIKLKQNQINNKNSNFICNGINSKHIECYADGSFNR